VLTLSDLAGKYFDFVNENISKGVIKNIDEHMGSLKSNIKSLIVYQLGNSLVSSGVGCGYYDPSGKEDGKTIGLLINNIYLNMF